jgi:hypothetical protein
MSYVEFILKNLNILQKCLFIQGNVVNQKKYYGWMKQRETGAVAQTTIIQIALKQK